MRAKDFLIWLLLRAVVSEGKGWGNQVKLHPLPVEKEVQKVSGKSSSSGFPVNVKENRVKRVSLGSSSIVAAKGNEEDGKIIKKGGLIAATPTTSFSPFEESKMLPWQASLILKALFPNRHGNGGKNGVTVPPPTAITSWGSSLTRGRKWMNTRSGKFFANGLQMMEQGARRLYEQFALHRRSLVVGLQGLLIAAVVLAVLRRLGNWYKGMAEYELLLDSTDYEYQAYGGCFNGIGSSLMSSMNMTAISEYRYTHLMRRLVDSLDVPCFPVAMKSFASETGRDVALLLEVRLTLTLPSPHSQFFPINRSPVH